MKFPDSKLNPGEKVYPIEFEFSSVGIKCKECNGTARINETICPFCNSGIQHYIWQVKNQAYTVGNVRITRTVEDDPEQSVFTEEAVLTRVGDGRSIVVNELECFPGFVLAEVACNQRNAEL
jgi:hypothetical protein